MSLTDNVIDGCFSIDHIGVLYRSYFYLGSLPHTYVVTKDYYIGMESLVRLLFIGFIKQNYQIL